MLEISQLPVCLAHFRKIIFRYLYRVASYHRFQFMAKIGKNKPHEPIHNQLLHQ